MSQPLTALCGTLDVALLAGQSPAELERSARRALNLAREVARDFDLLKDAFEAGDPGNQAGKVQWAELIRRAATALSRSQVKGRLSVTIRGQDKYLVRGDRARLYKATEDCLRIALDASPASRTVQTSLIRRGRRLLFTVHHSIKPPKPQQKNHRGTEVFPPESVRRWIVKRTIESQGGSFWAEPHPPRGQSLHILLPLQSARD